MSYEFSFIAYFSFAASLAEIRVSSRAKPVRSPCTSSLYDEINSLTLFYVLLFLSSSILRQYVAAVEEWKRVRTSKPQTAFDIRVRFKA